MRIYTFTYPLIDTLLYISVIIIDNINDVVMYNILLITYI